jgi:hypothetical protein
MGGFSRDNLLEYFLKRARAQEKMRVLGYGIRRV